MNTKKDIKLSNIKGLLIFLVVFGHLMELYKREYNEIFVFIYSFHMPLFILISGYFAKNVKLWKIINLILLYGIFQTFFNWFQFIIGDTTSFSKHYGTPIYHLWYIVSLGFWYTLAYAINKLHFNKYGKFIILLTIFVIAFLSRWYTNDIVSFMQGYIPNFSSYTLSFQRTLTFAPFFFAGFFLTKDALYKTYNLITQKTTMLLMTITMFFCFLIFDRKPVVELIYRGGFGTDRFLLPTDNFWNY